MSSKKNLEICKQKKCKRCTLPLRLHRIPMYKGCNPINHYCISCRIFVAINGFKNLYGSFSEHEDILKWYKHYNRTESKKVEIQKEVLRCPSLVELCAKKVCFDPMALLFLSEQELPYSLWKMIKDNIPKNYQTKRNQNLSNPQEIQTEE